MDDSETVNYLTRNETRGKNMKKIKKRWLILMTVAILLVSSFAMPKQQVFCDMA